MNEGLQNEKVRDGLSNFFLKQIIILLDRFIEPVQESLFKQIDREIEKFMVDKDIPDKPILDKTLKLIMQN